MSDHDESGHQPEPSGFWKSPTGFALVAFLFVVGLLLAYEHRAHVFTGSGILIALLAFCVGIHLFMHGGHGGHGGRGSDGGTRP